MGWMSVHKPNENGEMDFSEATIIGYQGDSFLDLLGGAMDKHTGKVDMYEADHATKQKAFFWLLGHADLREKAKELYKREVGEDMPYEMYRYHALTVSFYDEG